VNGESPVPDCQWLKYQQTQKAEEENRMDMNRRSDRCIEVRKLREIGNPEARDENGKEGK
jgi:hypothetical protein